MLADFFPHNWKISYSLINGVRGKEYESTLTNLDLSLKKKVLKNYKEDIIIIRHLGGSVS